MIVCPRLLDELDEVLHRPKFARFITSEQADVFLVLLRDQAEMDSDQVAVTELSRDPDDDYLIALARNIEADALVSGDKDLLELSDPPIRVLTPADALTQLDFEDGAALSPERRPQEGSTSNLVTTP